MRLSRYAYCLVASVLLVMVLPSTVTRGDTITVSEWFFSVQVDPPIGLDDEFWYTIENPCRRTISAQVGNSVSSSSLDFAWGEQFGTFLTQSQQVAVGAPSGSTFTSASGSIRLSVTEPLYLNINASWAYGLPADFMMTQFGLGIGGDSSQTVLFRQTYSRVTLPGEPSSGTLPIQGDVVLLPGETWRIQYWMNLEADAGPNFSATGSGYVNLTISPEVSSLALLSFALLCAFARRQRAIPR